MICRGQSCDAANVHWNYNTLKQQQQLEKTGKHQAALFSMVTKILVLINSKYVCICNLRWDQDIALRLWNLQLQYSVFSIRIHSTEFTDSFSLSSSSSAKTKFQFWMCTHKNKQISMVFVFGALIWDTSWCRENFTFLVTLPKLPKWAPEKLYQVLW